MDKIDKIYYINLEHRTDRFENINNQFNKINFTNYERINAIKHEYGPLGCCKSHLKVLNKIKEESCDIAMIIEDDLEFLVNREILDEYIEEFIKDDKLMVLCIAFNTKGTVKRHTNKLYITTDTQTTCCYIIKKDIVNELIVNFKESEEGLTELVNNKLIPIYPMCAIDQNWKKLQKNNIFAIPNIRLAKQIKSYSDVINRVVDYKV